MKRIYEFFCLYLLASLAFAAGPDYQAGVKDSVTINCVNPTTRTDGKALAWATEGGHVDFFIGKDATLQWVASLSGRMGQGCQATTVDLRPLPTDQQYYLHVKASDSAERTSSPSTGFAFFRSAQAAPPPPPAETRPNLALSKVTTVSSIETTSYTGAKAVDGLMTTRWASVLPGKDAEWISVDLGALYSLNHVIVKWECYAKAFNIQVSTDGQLWSTVSALTGVVPSSGVIATNDVSFTPAEGRYVRIQGVTRGTPWGYSIYELQAYGDPAATPCTVTELAACDAARKTCVDACNK